MDFIHPSDLTWNKPSLRRFFPRIETFSEAVAALLSNDPRMTDDEKIYLSKNLLGFIAEVYLGNFQITEGEFNPYYYEYCLECKNMVAYDHEH